MSSTSNELSNNPDPFSIIKEKSVVMIIDVPRGKQAKTAVKALAKYFDIKGTVQRINISREFNQIDSDDHTGIKIVFESNHHNNLGLFIASVYSKFKQCNLLNFWLEDKKLFSSFNIIKTSTNVIDSNIKHSSDSSDNDSLFVEVTRFKNVEDGEMTWDFAKELIQRCTLLNALSDNNENQERQISLRKSSKAKKLREGIEEKNNRVTVKLFKTFSVEIDISKFTSVKEVIQYINEYMKDIGAPLEETVCIIKDEVMLVGVIEIADFDPTKQYIALSKQQGNELLK